MTTTNPDFPAGFVHAPFIALRGIRIYIHSTDLYDEILVGARAAGWPPVDGAVELRCRLPITTQPAFHFDGEVPAPNTNAASASFQLEIAGRTGYGRIIATARQAIERKPYDEARIWAVARFGERTIEPSSDCGMSPIEVITALNVLQHNTLLPPTGGRRWLLARLSLVRPLVPADAVGIKITLDHVVSRTMTLSSVTTPNGRLGTIRYLMGFPDRSQREHGSVRIAVTALTRAPSSGAAF
jgi:hypothetical protein